MIQHIVWDWNGTLLDDLHATVDAVNFSLHSAGFAGITVERYCLQYGRPLEVFYGRLVGRRLTSAEWRKLDRSFSQRYLNSIVPCSLADDAFDALEWWSPRSQSLLSMSDHDNLVDVTNEYNVNKYFMRVDGRRGVSGASKFEYLARHVKLLRQECPILTPETICVIGDSVDDATAAVQIGATAILYAGGYTHRAALDRVGVPVAETLTDAVRMLAAT
ncbi:MAG: HAD hydrolase-like protein [Pseudonocardiaceae bacterium]